MALQYAVPHVTRSITAVLLHEPAMLACHASQKEWQDVSHGMNTYLDRNEAHAPLSKLDELAI